MDVRHPFFIRPKLTIIYACFWIGISAADVLLQWLVYAMNLKSSVIDVSSYYILFAVIGPAIWYIIRFNTLEENSVFRLILFNLIGATIIIFIWIYVGTVLYKIFQPEMYEKVINSVPGRILWGFFFYIVYVVFFYALQYYNDLKEKIKRESELKGLVKEAELHALKSQINPHFLFNSLNSISSLTMSNPAKAQEMVINLSKLMRYSLKYDQREIVPFEKELENNKLYLNIEKVRFGQKLNPIFQIDEKCLNAVIPNMILQPLYENAIKYGVYEATEPVDVVTSARFNGNFLEISITNTYDPDIGSKKGEGIGLKNIRERLQIIYGNPMLLKIEFNKSEFKVTLSIPQN
jgi:two-component system, LytTR family, sensor kinase